MFPAVMPTYARANLTFERGEGAYLYTADGRRYLDFASGIAVTALGHNHPHLVKALTEQAGRVWHLSNLYDIPEQTQAAERLVAATFADSVFFGNSGAEAVECGLKAVRRHFDRKGEPGRYRVITFRGSFHGRTLATISAAGNEKYMDGYGPEIDGFDHVPFGDLDAVRAAITPETAAILLEPVQGEGGIRQAEIAFMKGLREIADEHGLLLFLDEVQTGMGRTGRLFAYEWAGIEPDIMAVAKGLGGGFPVGACLMTEEVAQVMTAGSHGTTFGGGPLAMAVVNGVLDVMLADGFVEHVEKMGDMLVGRLNQVLPNYPDVFESVRGSGLMLGLKCVAPNADVVAHLRAKGMLTAPAGDNVVRLLPPLIIDETQVDEAVEAIRAVAEELEG